MVQSFPVLSCVSLSLSLLSTRPACGQSTWPTADQTPTLLRRTEQNWTIPVCSTEAPQSVHISLLHVNVLLIVDSCLVGLAQHTSTRHAVVTHRQGQGDKNRSHSAWRFVVLVLTVQHLSSSGLLDCGGSCRSSPVSLLDLQFAPYDVDKLYINDTCLKPGVWDRPSHRAARLTGPYVVFGHWSSEPLCLQQ